MQVKCRSSRGRRRKAVGDVSCELSEWQHIQLPLAQRWLVEKVSLALSFQGEDKGRVKGEPQVREKIAAREKADRQAQV